MHNTDQRARRLGIPGADTAGWGDHVCAFYKNKEELLNLTVPFIQAGLEEGEFCMWITGDPVTERDAFHALEAVIPDVHRYLVQKQLEILPHHQWYLSRGIFVAQTVLQNWVSKAKHAEVKGFAGIRITGNPFWLQSGLDWQQFGAYERSVNEAIRQERIVALCTYPSSICDNESITKTCANHGAVLIPNSNGTWQRLSASS